MGGGVSVALGGLAAPFGFWFGSWLGDGLSLNGVWRIGGSGDVGCGGLQVGVGVGELGMIGGCTRFIRLSGMVCGGCRR